MDVAGDREEDYDHEAHEGREDETGNNFLDVLVFHVYIVPSGRVTLHEILEIILATFGRGYSLHLLGRLRKLPRRTVPALPGRLSSCGPSSR